MRGFSESRKRERKIYLPIDQPEKAKQAESDYLLAQPIFERIAEVAKESIKKTNNATASNNLTLLDLDDYREHNAILLDGGRGTGKSTILVNLPSYMKNVGELKDLLLILKPVDPTLLENDDDLFLNILVAALLRNEEINNAIKNNPGESRIFYEQLQLLGQALESAQKQKNEFGMDKLRAFIGNHNVSEQVHRIFYEALKITGKRLIVLPIDDVDTSLNHAFNNLEVVRRYLATPYVLTVISGDLNLFHEVIWRRFYRGISMDCAERPGDVIKLAVDLAVEYERKLIPVKNRIKTLTVDEYFRSESYFLYGSGRELFSLKVCYGWLSYLHNFEINGFEGSRLVISFQSLRSFCQLVSSISNELLIFDDFYKKRVHDLGGGDSNLFIFPNDTRDAEFQELIDKSIVSLSQVYHVGDYGAESRLLFEANRYLVEFSKSKNISRASNFGSIFNTPFYQPLEQSNQKYLIEEAGSELRGSWKKHLSDRVADDVWLNNLPETTVFSYPVPDKGLILGDFLKPTRKDSRFVFDILVQKNIYSEDDSCGLIFFGRVFEILMLSMISDVGEGEIISIINRNPYFSVISFSGTKMINVRGDVVESFEKKGEYLYKRKNDAKLKFAVVRNIFIKKLCDDINEWRARCLLSGKNRPNALIIYRVLNKFFTQIGVAYGSLASEVSGLKINSNRIKFLAQLGLMAHNSFCSTFGSFEVPLNESISTENAFLMKVKFEDSELFIDNVRPFLKRVSENSYEMNDAIKGWAGALYSHPLKAVFEAVMSDNEISKAP